MGLGITGDSLKFKAKRRNNLLDESSYNSHVLNDETILNNSESHSPVIFNGFPGKLKNNFINSASFKSPAVWNCDWNLNNIPEMHIK